jgi:demethylmenaquinone methyltransferase/2-methoxy-6-polyprenyl-1,4-benzoquinol methylase
MTTLAVQRRYRSLAPVYDWANLDWLLYAAARRRAIELLELRPGARVLDVACGTGANFALIQQRIGAAGELVGIDLTAGMLDRARARVRAQGWANVELREADICDPPGDLGAPFDAVLCTLGLSVIPEWRRALDVMVTLARPGGRVAVMDAGFPERGGPALTRPFAAVLSRLFAADCARRPWLALGRDTAGAVAETFAWGWVTAAAGTRAQA